MAEPASPIRRLAAESALFETLPADVGRLFLWRSTAAVVVGKNQIPWRECDPAAVMAAGGVFARRQTGGGTVYHDPGNVCYSLMMPRAGYDADAVGELIADALRPLGLELTVGPRHVLMAGDRKVSGTAFCYRRQRVLHHGTLLIDADLSRLQRWLRPALPAIAGKGVASVPSPVVNLLQLQPKLTIDAVFRALATACGATTPVAPDPVRTQAEFARFAADDWRFGLTPAFSLPLPGAELHCRKGLVEAAPPELADVIGMPFHEVLPRLAGASSP